MRTEQERFWSKALVGDGCWEWVGAASPHGYGNFGRGGKTWSAHRVAWELAVGPIPRGRWVLHRCDNRRCVRPGHLFLGDNAANMRDMHSKSRGRSKLTAEEARSVCARYAAGESPTMLAEEYGVDRVQVWAIGTGKSWGHSHDLEPAKFLAGRRRVRTRAA